MISDLKAQPLHSCTTVFKYVPVMQDDEANIDEVKQKIAEIQTSKDSEKATKLTGELFLKYDGLVKRLVNKLLWQYRYKSNFFNNTELYNQSYIFFCDIIKNCNYQKIDDVDAYLATALKHELQNYLFENIANVKVSSNVYYKASPRKKELLKQVYQKFQYDTHSSEADYSDKLVYGATAEEAVCTASLKNAIFRLPYLTDKQKAILNYNYFIDEDLSGDEIAKKLGCTYKSAQYYKIDALKKIREDLTPDSLRTKTYIDFKIKKQSKDENFRKILADFSPEKDFSTCSDEDIKGAINKLPEELKEIVISLYFKKEPVKKVLLEEELKISRKMINNRLEKALEKISEELIPEKFFETNKEAKFKNFKMVLKNLSPEKDFSACSDEDIKGAIDKLPEELKLLILSLYFKNKPAAKTVLEKEFNVSHKTIRCREKKALKQISEVLCPEKFSKTNKQSKYENFKNILGLLYIEKDFSACSDEDIKNAVEKLPEELKEIVISLYFSDAPKTKTALAKQLHISDTTVKNWEKKAFKQITKELLGVKQQSKYENFRQVLSDYSDGADLSVYTNAQICTAIKKLSPELKHIILSLHFKEKPQTRTELAKKYDVQNRTILAWEKKAFKQIIQVLLGVKQQSKYENFKQILNAFSHEKDFTKCSNAQICTAIKKLSPELKHIILSLHFKEKPQTITELANILKIPVSTVKSRKKSAFKQITKELLGVKQQSKYENFKQILNAFSHEKDFTKCSNAQICTAIKKLSPELKHIILSLHFKEKPQTRTELAKKYDISITTISEYEKNAFKQIIEELKNVSQ